MRRGLLAGLVFLGTWLGACTSEHPSYTSGSEQPETQKSPATRSLTIVFTANVSGQARQLAVNHKGGLQARIEHFESISGPKISIDAGNHLFRSAHLMPWRAQQATQTAELLIDGAAKTNTRVMLPGERDLALGFDKLGSWARQSGLTLVSSNLQVQNSTVSVSPLKILTEGGLKIAVIGCSDINSDVLVTNDCMTALMQASKSVRGEGADWTVALLQLDLDHARRVVAALGPAVDLAVVATEAKQQKLQIDGGAPILIPNRRGQSVGVVRLQHEAGKTTMTTTVTALRSETALDPVATKTTEVGVGSQACKSCHPKAYRFWQRSAHAKALATLHTKRQSRNGDCTYCHASVQGRGVRGFGKNTKAIESVGCERCHGLGTEHVKTPEIARLGTVSPDRCTGCHRPQADQAPFNLEEHWRKVIGPGHGPSQN